MDVPVPQILVGIVVPVAYRRQATARGGTCIFRCRRFRSRLLRRSRRFRREQLAERIVEQIVDVPDAEDRTAQIVDVPVPQITEETVEVAMLIPQERITTTRTLEETVNVPLLQIQEQILAVVKAPF